MSLLSPDILHQIFTFFVSNDQIVDGESLRVASSVCKQWQRVANSKSLWAIPVGVKEFNGSNEYNDGELRSLTVHQSLRIREQVGGVPSQSFSMEESLIGFVNLKCYGAKFPELHFYVRERVTGSQFLLSISRDGQKAPSLIRDVYVNHFELKSEFLLRDSNTNAGNFFPPQPFPLGICVWKGRVVRWYRCGNETEARKTIDLVSPKKDGFLRHGDAFTEPKKNFTFVRHLIDLENDLLRERSDNSFHAEGRQHIVDWMTEIVECFALEDRTIFQAMILFDRFIASCDRIVCTSNFQLVAGSCLLIASKCNKVFVTEKDISFCCDNLFSVAHVKAMEEMVLKQLDWKLACPTSLEFILVFSAILGIENNSRMFCLCSYILEISLAYNTSLNTAPSIVGASSIVLSNYALQNDNTPTLWPDKLVDATGLKLMDLVECSVQLSQDVENGRLASTRLDMIHRRHSKPCRHNASEIPIPFLTSKTVLTTFEERSRSRIC